MRLFDSYDRDEQKRHHAKWCQESEVPGVLFLPQVKDDKTLSTLPNVCVALRVKTVREMCRACVVKFAGPSRTSLTKRLVQS